MPVWFHRTGRQHSRSENRRLNLFHWNEPLSSGSRDRAWRTARPVPGNRLPDRDDQGDEERTRAIPRCDAVRTRSKLHGEQIAGSREEFAGHTEVLVPLDGNPPAGQLAQQWLLSMLHLRDFPLRLPGFVVALTTSLLTGVVFGLGPALEASGSVLQDAPKEGRGAAAGTAVS